MNRLLIAILTISVSFAISAQGDPVLTTTWPGGTLSGLLDDLEKETEARFYYNPEWLGTIKVNAASQGANIEEVLGRALDGSGLRYFREGNGFYLYQGTRIISDLPLFEKPLEKKIEEEQLADESAPTDGMYLQTKKMSEENFITIGSKGSIKNGREYVVSGHIDNKQTGEALIGAVVLVKELGSATITDVNGNFELNLHRGHYTITVRHMAMKEMEYGLNVLSDGKFSLELENELIELEEVTVSDQRHSNVKGMLMGYERISTKAMKEIPVVMGEKDVLKVAQMLPGVQSAGEGSSGFNVRGGTADQNMFYINKVSVYNTSHLFGFFTSFSPDIISDFSLYKNNIPSKYGGRIASIFDINTRQGNKDQFFAQGGISPITGHVSVEGPIVKEKVSFVASGRSTYSDWLLRKIDDQDLRESNASFYDGTLGLNADFNPNNQVSAFVYLSSDKFSLSDRNDYNYSNNGGSISWKHRFSASLSYDLSVATSTYQFESIDKNNITEAYVHGYRINHTEGRADFLYMPGGNHRFEFGASGILYNLDRGDILPYGEESTRVPISLGQEQGVESALYVSDEFRLFSRLHVLLGLRYSFFGQIGPSTIQTYEEGLPRNKYTMQETLTYGSGELVKPYSGIEPRVAFNYELGNSTSVKASYNRLRQYIFLLSNTFAIAPNDQWKLTDYHISPPLSDQVSVGFYQDFTKPGISLSVEVYKKWIQDVVEYKDGADFISPEPIETQVLQGDQDSRGLEVMIKKHSNSLTGWLSYTWSRSTVLVNGFYEEDKINGGMAYPSNFDRPHSFNLVSNYRISRRLSVSSNVVYASGRPVTQPVAVYYSEGQKYMLYSERNKYRIPDYFRIDLSINLEGNLKFKKMAHSFWMLNIYNLSGRRNAYSVFYEAREGQIKGYKLSIFAQPIVTLSWNFKFGNYNSD